MEREFGVQERGRLSEGGSAKELECYASSIYIRTY